jgi:polyketide cyclase/dehydrase/lipid transport protein
VTIERPVEDVSAFLADLQNVPRWNHAIEDTRKTSQGSVGVGATYRQTRSTPTRSQERFAVTVFDPTYRLAIEGEIGPFQARVSYVLESVDGSTRLTNAMELTPSSGASWLLAPLAGPRIKAAVAENLGTLKQILETPEGRGVTGAS